jgi:hypothetical protein
MQGTLSRSRAAGCWRISERGAGGVGAVALQQAMGEKTPPFVLGQWIKPRVGINLSTQYRMFGPKDPPPSFDRERCNRRTVGLTRSLSYSHP